MSLSPDILVVGGGLIGGSIAFKLAGEGLSVTLIDKAEPGHEASWAGGGILTPVHLSDYPESMANLCQASIARYPDWIAAIRRHTSIDPELRATGLLLLARNGAGRVTADALETWKRARNQPAVRVGSADLQRLQPGLSGEIRDALHLPDVAQVRNNRLTRALLEACAARKVRILPQTPAMGLLGLPRAVTGVRTPLGAITAGTTILAAGAWSTPFAKEAGLRLTVQPIKGQILIKEGPVDFCRRILLEEGTYLVPRADGRILIGSTLEDVGFDKTVVRETVAGIEERAAAILPGVSGLKTVARWAGLRPGTADRLPYLGPSSIPGLIIAAGHFRNGIVLAPVTGDIVCDWVRGKKPEFNLTPFSPTRSVA